MFKDINKICEREEGEVVAVGGATVYCVDCFVSGQSAGRGPATLIFLCTQTRQQPSFRRAECFVVAWPSKGSAQKTSLPPVSFLFQTFNLFYIDFPPPTVYSIHREKKKGKKAGRRGKYARERCGRGRYVEAKEEGKGGRDDGTYSGAWPLMCLRIAIIKQA